MYKLLIADDEKWLKERLAKTIDWESFHISQVATASDGQEAYSHIITQHPDIVITDVRMPILSGLELIRQVREQGLNTHFIIISGYADFNYARQALKMQVADYITKPVRDEELIQCVLNCEADIESNAMRTQELEQLKEQCCIGKEAMVSKFYQELLNGNIKTPEALTELCSKMHISLAFNNYGCIVLDLNILLQKNSSVIGNTVKLFSGDLENQLKKELAITPLFVTAVQSRLVAVLGTDLPQKSIPDTLDALYQFIEQHTAVAAGCSLAIGTGEFFASPLSLHLSLSQAVSSLQYRMYSKQFMESNIDELKDASFSMLGISNSIIDTIAIHILHRSRDEVTHSIDNLVSSLSDIKTPSEFQLVTFKITNSIINKLLHSGVPAEALSNIPILYLDYFSNLHSAQSMSALIEKICDSIFASLSHSGERKQTRIIKNILEFIDRNYMLPITSKSVAEEFYFNPSYFSGMFKDHVGIPFTKYLVNIRMDESKRLLRTTNIKISNIARRVGYEDIQYFMKIFKTNTGTTPNAYRDLYS